MKVEEYRLKAEELRRLAAAATAGDPSLAAEYLKLAEAWDSMARLAEAMSCPDPV